MEKTPLMIAVERLESLERFHDTLQQHIKDGDQLLDIVVVSTLKTKLHQFKCDTYGPLIAAQVEKDIREAKQSISDCIYKVKETKN